MCVFAVFECSKKQAFSDLLQNKQPYATKSHICSLLIGLKCFTIYHFGVTRDYYYHTLRSVKAVDVETLLVHFVQIGTMFGLKVNNIEGFGLQSFKVPKTIIRLFALVFYEQQST